MSDIARDHRAQPVPFIRRVRIRSYRSYLNYFRYDRGMTVQHFAYSAFLRGPSQVLPSPADADVILERRDEENLVLT